MISVNNALFFEIFGKIFDAFRQNFGIFARHTAIESGPQYKFKPKKVEVASRDHIYWLTLVALTDRRTNSTFLYKNFAKMFDRNPTLMGRGVYPSLRRMTKLFRAYRIAVPVSEIRFFIELIKRTNVVKKLLRDLIIFKFSDRKSPILTILSDLNN